MRRELAAFVDYGAKPIVSSPYIESEFNRVFPEAEKKPSVVYLSSFNDYEPLSKSEIDTVLVRYNIRNDYILYANNWALHKNMQPVLGAYYQVKQKYPDIKLVISGYGPPEQIICKCNSPYYLDHIEEYDDEYDVISLGLLSDEDFSAVLQGAKLIVNSSLCEAGSGSALDAWNCKIPVAFSSIPSFMQQLEFLGTKAEVFDPRNSDSIAKAILTILDNPDKVKDDAEISYKAMKKYGWDKVAQSYIDIFEQNMPSGEYQKLTELYPSASKDDLICYEELIINSK
jgi:glycosyltransferase involved in cell wall biosynthesis